MKNTASLLMLCALFSGPACAPASNAQCAASATPVREKPRIGEPCPLPAPSTVAGTTPQVLLELAWANIESDAGGHPLPVVTAAPNPNSWLDDPHVSIVSTTLLLADLDSRRRIEWNPAGDAQTELEVTPHWDATSGQIRVEVSMRSSGSKKPGAGDAHTTVVVASQQSVVLAVPSGAGRALILTPYLARTEAELAQLRVCKRGPWVDSAEPLPTPRITDAAAAPPSRKATEPLTYPTWEIGGTVVRDLPSELTGKLNRLIISIPASFQKEPTRRYPVLYLLDGQWDFPLVNATAGNLRYDKLLPEMLIVGLSYGGEQPDYDQLRVDDFTPTRAKGHDGNERGGGAPRFLAWLETAVIPLLEQEYRADSQHRILAGSSSGGLFTLYALFEKPELFWSYMAVSPSVGWDNRDLFRREKAFRATHPKLPHRLWLSSGSEEWPDFVANELSFFRQLAASRYDELALKHFSINGARHSSVKAEAFTRALRYIMEPLLKSSAAPQ